MAESPAPPPAPLTPEQLQWENRIERWRQATRVAARTMKRLTKHKKSLRLQFNMEEGGPLVPSLSTPDDKTMRELAVALRPLLHPKSDLYHDAILTELLAETPAELHPEIDLLRTAIEKQQPTPFEVNEKKITGKSAFILLADRIFFTSDTDAIAFRAELDKTPEVRDILWFAAYSYCIEMAKLLDYSRDRLASKGAFRRPPRTNLCIYCKTTEGPFRTAEHTLPQALGNSHSILPRGFVCDLCQNSFSVFEDAAVNSVPLSIQRFLMVNQTKDGKFTTAKFQGLHLERTSPNSIKIQAFDDQAFKVETLPDGQSKINLSASGKIDHIAIGRVLVKAALGGLAIENSRDFVLDAKFDDARTFIKTGAGLDARLFISKQAKPMPGIAVRFIEGDKAFGAVFRIYGALYIVTLTSAPLESMPPEAGVEFIALDLANPVAVPLQAAPTPSENKAT